MIHAHIVPCQPQYNQCIIFGRWERREGGLAVMKLSVIMQRRRFDTSYNLGTSALSRYLAQMTYTHSLNEYDKIAYSTHKS